MFGKHEQMKIWKSWKKHEETIRESHLKQTKNKQNKPQTNPEQATQNKFKTSSEQAQNKLKTNSKQAHILNIKNENH